MLVFFELVILSVRLPLVFVFLRLWCLSIALVCFLSVLFVILGVFSSPFCCLASEKVFVSQERVSGFPERGADLRGSPGSSGEVWGTSGEVWGTSGEALDCC